MDVGDLTVSHVVPLHQRDRSKPKKPTLAFKGLKRVSADKLRMLASCTNH